jgi:hypothetical protein
MLEQIKSFFRKSKPVILDDYHKISHTGLRFALKYDLDHSIENFANKYNLTLFENTHFNISPRYPAKEPILRDLVYMTEANLSGRYSVNIYIVPSS